MSKIPMPKIIELGDAVIEERAGQNAAKWNADGFPVDYRMFFAAIKIPQGVSRVDAPIRGLNGDLYSYVHDNLPAGVRISAEHNSIFLEGDVLEGATIKGREKNIFSARRLAPNSKIDGGMLVILGETDHLRPSEQAIERCVPYKPDPSPVIVVPEKHRLEAFVRLAGMLPPEISEREKIQPELKNINRALQQLQKEGKLTAIFPNGSSKIDMSLFSGLNRS